MIDLKDLEKNSHKIGKDYRNEEGNLIRKVDGVEIKQIEEKTEEDRRLNNAINLWRMRTKQYYTQRICLWVVFAQIKIIEL